jgi:hypothetical protein
MICIDMMGTLGGDMASCTPYIGWCYALLGDEKSTCTHCKDLLAVFIHFARVALLCSLPCLKHRLEAILIYVSL